MIWQTKEFKEVLLKSESMWRHSWTFPSKVFKFDRKIFDSLCHIESPRKMFWLTTFHLKLALLCIVRVNNKVHCTRQPQRQLHHVQDGFVLIQPHVVIWNCHCLECHRFCVLEERIGSPHIFKPFNLKQTIFWRHIFRKSQTMIFPCLCKENISGVGLGRLNYDEYDGKLEGDDHEWRKQS